MRLEEPLPHQQGIFTNHGAPVRADEARTAAVCINGAGDCRFVIAARGYAVIVNPENKTSKQIFFPENHYEYPFSSFSDRKGFFYTGAGNMFLVLDPFSERFVFYEKPLTENGIVGFSFAEDCAGRIYTTTYPSCKLLRYDPNNQTVTELARLDPDQKYAMSLAVSSNGWVYAGIGTEHQGIAAFDPHTFAVHQLLCEEERKKGMGQVVLSVDGHVYGCTYPDDDRASWYILDQTSKTLIPESAVPESDFSGKGFQRVHRKFPEPWSLVSFSLSEKEVTLYNRSTDRNESFPVRYKSRGATLSTLIAGPDGSVYGTSNHPLHLYRYDPTEALPVDFGGALVEQGGGGNIAAYAVQGSIIAGAAYAGGNLHLIDTSRPFETENIRLRNPKLVATHPEVHRPRCSLAYPDGEHVIFGGYPGYGAVGGGLCIFNVVSFEDELIPNEALIPYHSTTCLEVLANGDLLGGTSVEAPGGAASKETEGKLYTLSWQNRQVTHSFVPVRGAREISLMIMDDKQRAHGLTSDKRYFVCDTNSLDVLHIADVSSCGAVVRNGFVKDADGTIYGVTQQAIFIVDTDRFAFRLIAKPPKPITAGLALLGRSLFFGCGSELWEYRLA